MKIGQNSSIPPIVKNLLIINIALYALSLILFYKFNINLIDYLGMHYFSNPDFKPWQLLTHMFMHAFVVDGRIYFSHILFNMFGLYMFGSFLENLMGGKRFLILYLVSGFGAIFLHLGIQMFEAYQMIGSVSIDPHALYPPQYTDKLGGIYFSSMIGASGALYGVMAAFAFLFPNTELYLFFIPIPIKAKFLIPGFVLIDLFAGVTHFSGDNVAHFAHIGGAIFGFLLIYFWNKRNRSSFY